MPSNSSVIQKQTMSDATPQDESYPQFDADELKVTTEDGDPAIELPNGQTIILGTQLQSEPNARVNHDTDLESAWGSGYWTIHPTASKYPSVEMQPRVADGDSNE